MALVPVTTRLPVLVTGMSEKPMSSGYRLLAGKGSGAARSPMKKAATAAGRPRKTKDAPAVPRVRKTRPPRPPTPESETESEEEEEEVSDQGTPSPPRNRHLASLRRRPPSVPPPVAPVAPPPKARAPKEKAPEAVAEARSRVLAKKKENVKVETKLDKIREEPVKKVVRPTVNQVIKEGGQRVYAVDSSAKVVLPPIGSQTPVPGAALLPPLFYEPIGLLGPGIRTGTHPSMEPRGANRSILHTFKLGTSFPTDGQVILVRFARYAPFFTTPALDVNPDNLQVTCNGHVVLKVDNVNYGIAADKPLVAAPVEIPKEFLNHQNTLKVEYTVRQNDSTEDFLLFVELARRRPTEELVQEIQKRTLSITDGALRAFQILSPDEDDGIMSGSSIVNLICPLSLKALEVPVRGRDCGHLECFSAANYLEANKFRKPKWTCPKCKMSVPFEDLIVDEFMTDVLSFTSQPTVDIVAEKDRLVVREKQVLKKADFLVVHDRPSLNNLDQSIVILD